VQALYTPEPVADFEGLEHFDSVFYDMTVNAFVVWDPSTKEAAFFDTGADGDPMLEFATSRGLRVAKMFITHIHTDHMFDLDRLLQKTKAQAWVSE
jgi:glyoxylase-like metal-dependent hydrolase (beta-lactamase superfamily II)